MYIRRANNADRERNLCWAMYDNRKEKYVRGSQREYSAKNIIYYYDSEERLRFTRECVRASIMPISSEGSIRETC